MFTIMKTIALVPLLLVLCGYPLLLLLVGCSDEEMVAPEVTESFVAGYVKRADGSNTPVGGVEVHLVEYAFTQGWIGGGLPYPTGWSSTKCTKDTGYFSFKFDFRLVYGYTVEVAYHVNQYLYSESVDVHPGITQYVTVPLPSYASAYPCN